ncbi:glycoside hydrolase family 3 N-terminal domain-containing protein, partial [Balneolaceae bacterium ANBcel3]|nr:glycoside hydrolase family 3 N-terminal domain-containing protein [Balneolaceae bacterium ANBcel3]
MEKKWVEEKVRGMSLEEKAGQLLMVAFFSWEETARKQFTERLLSIHAGGVFHFSAKQKDLAAFVSDLQKRSALPMLVASDFELGAGWFIPEAVRFQRPMARGYSGSETSEYEIGKVIARQGRSVGTNLTFSPVVDVNTDPLCPDVNIRAYSDRPDRVTELASGYVKGL